MRKRLVSMLAAAFVLTGLGASAGPRPDPGPPAAGIGGPFTLIDQDGRRVTEQSLLGRPSVIFFGYIFCPEVCPTTLTRLTHDMHTLGRDADRLNVVFVSIDSARDGPKQLKAYLGAFDPRIRGYTGSPAEIARIAREYRVFYRKVPLPGGNYAYDHSATVYLMDAQGRFVEPIGYDEPDAMTMASLRRLLGR